MSAKWYLGTGAQNDVVISTSIHLARNIKQFPFPASLSMQDKLKVNSVIKNATDDLTDYSYNYYEKKCSAITGRSKLRAYKMPLSQGNNLRLRKSLHFIIIVGIIG